jgi:hypothetical protein
MKGFELTPKKDGVAQRHRGAEKTKLSERRGFPRVTAALRDNSSIRGEPDALLNRRISSRKL